MPCDNFQTLGFKCVEVEHYMIRKTNTTVICHLLVNDQVGLKPVVVINLFVSYNSVWLLSAFPLNQFVCLNTLNKTSFMVFRYTKCNLNLSFFTLHFRHLFFNFKLTNSLYKCLHRAIQIYLKNKHFCN